MYLMAASAPLAAADFTFHHENLLGTSVEFRINTSDENAARTAEAAALAEIQRLSSVLNTWSPDSEISRCLAQPGDHELSPDLLSVLRQADHWQQASGGLFNPRVAVFTPLWDSAAKRQSPPTAEERAPLIASASLPAWQLPTVGSARVPFTGEKAVTLSGISKGRILDQAGQAAYVALPAAPQRSLTLNIGGDIRHWGEQPSSATIADPHADAENAAPASTVTLHDQALATSGGYRRGWFIGGQLHSHVLDPHTGLPSPHLASASVITAETASANALAVILSLMPVPEALAFAEKHGAQCLLITQDGTPHRSPAWPEHTVTLASADVDSDAEAANQLQAPPPGPEIKAELTLHFEFPPQSKRPYIAAYISDDDGYPVRTLLLWIVQGSKREKWLPDLRHWYKDDKTRRLVDGTDLVETRSSATRRAGAYSIVWNGMDDHEQPVPAGSYTLVLDAAREKGTRQVIKHSFDWNGTAFTTDLPSNTEITRARLECKALP